MFISDTNPIDLIFLRQANEKCERVWEIYFKILFSYPVNLTIASVASVLISWLIYGNFDTDNFLRVVKIKSVLFIFLIHLAHI